MKRKIKKWSVTMFITLLLCMCFQTVHVFGAEPKPTIATSKRYYTYNQLNIKFTKPASEYRIYRSTQKGTRGSLIATTTKPTYRDKDIIYTKTYYYQVKAKYTAENGKSTYSALSPQLKVNANLTRPSAVSVSAESTTKLKITWNKTKDAEKYILYRCNTKNGTYKAIKTTTSLSFSDIGLTPDTQYYYGIKTYKKSGTTEYYSRISPPTAATTKATGSFVSKLKASLKTTQIVAVVANSSGSLATISYHQKNANGVWIQKHSVSGCIGLNGLGKAVEGDSKTPVGTYKLGPAFGIDSNPGTALPYTKVDNSHYWVDDSTSKYYNQFVSTKTVHKDWSGGEHLIDYSGSYDYAVALNYNPQNIPYKGSAFFLHCKMRDYTGGCIAIPKTSMKYILKQLKPGARIVIGTQTTIYQY